MRNAEQTTSAFETTSIPSPSNSALTGSSPARWNTSPMTLRQNSTSGAAHTSTSEFRAQSATDTVSARTAPAAAHSARSATAAAPRSPPRVVLPVPAPLQWLFIV